MPLNRRDVLLASSAAALAGPAAAMNARPPQAEFSALTGEMTERLLRMWPEQASTLGLDKGERAGLKRALSDRSSAGVAADRAICREILTRQTVIDPGRLPHAEQISFKVMRYAAELGRDGAAFDYGDNTLASAMAESATPYVVNQMTGSYNGVPEFLNTAHTVEGAADAEAYLARLEAFAGQLDGETARITRDAARGVMPPAFVVDTQLGQMTGFRARPVASWGLVESLVRRTAAQGIAGDWSRRAAAVCQAKVAPALDRQIAALQQLRSRATADAGVWKLPQGEAYYGWLLKVGTSTPMTAAEVHRMGLEQVAALSAQMDGLLRAQGLTQGSVGARMAALGRDPRNLFPDTDAGRAELLRYLTGRIAAVRARLPQAFATLPRADVIVKRVPESIQAGAANGYMNSGSMDGSRPAIYYVNLTSTANWPRFSLPSLTFHEALPGHAWQGAFVNSMPPIRSLLGGFNAYVEGWALYAEQLGDELGLYADDPLGKLGYLQSIQFRACRLVVDTGLHAGAYKWTREQAVRYMVENTGRTEQAMRSEVDRYCATPGQACGYKVGHSEIDRLRERAQAALGSRFDLRGFDDALVKDGAVPLTVLGEIVDAHIASARG